MTILNVAVGDCMVAILTDTRTSKDGAATGERCQKCETFPLLGAVAAITGDGGMTTILRDLSLLLRAWTAGTIVEIAQWAPGVLKSLAAEHHFTGAGRIVIAGGVEEAESERAYAFQFDAPDWEARSLREGAHLHPGPIEFRGAAAVRLTVSGKFEPVDLPTMTAKPDYHDSLQNIRRAPIWQVRENPVTCGGELLLTTLRAGGPIQQMRFSQPVTQ